jgi:CRP-like cAMP-binding protein
MLSITNENSIRIEVGECLFKENDTVQSVYLLKRGHITCVTLNQDRVIPIFSVKDQGLVGEDCLFLKEPKYFYSAVALESSVVVKLAKSDIMKFIDSSSDWIKNIFTDMSEKIEHTKSIISEHRIIDDKLNGGLPFSQKEEILIKKALK